ncbi:lysoplasmalogenase [Agrobacterium sp. a22-2]|uniref:lysoplasmalogenase n=1 Tax=Agrobacterium sp. a22-2 TaxID=2283840 RepID=UPI001446CA1F|nr:lysoplasmalogenase [Agrobacterium sp. a22-2]NKN37047.1 lysoplasmalogenase [Agrobacterium sp. a22-2]
MQIVEGTILGTALLLGISYLRLTGDPTGHRRTLFKVLPIALLLLYAFLAGGPAWLLAALALSAFGDACLAYEGEAAFLSGLVSFLLAHVAYCLLFAGHADSSLIVTEPWRLAVALLLAASTAALVIVLWRPAGKLAPAVALYGLTIVSMALLALSTGLAIPFIGAVLFVGSDTLLSLQTFLVAKGSRWRRPLSLGVWITYFAAQFLLTVSLVSFAG